MWPQNIYSNVVHLKSLRQGVKSSPGESFSFPKNISRTRTQRKSQAFLLRNEITVFPLAEIFFFFFLMREIKNEIGLELNHGHFCS